MATVLDRPTYRIQPDYTAPLVTRSRFTIDRGIPCPPSKRGTGRDFVYPFADMLPGDSFEVTLSTYSGGRGAPTINKMTSALNSCTRGYAKRHNPTARFCTRKTSDTAVRVWRTA